MLRSLLKITSFGLTVCSLTVSVLWIFDDSVAGAENAKAAKSKSASSYHKKILEDHPVGYWRLGEAKGPHAKDETKHGHHGTYHGTPLFHELGAIHHDTDTAVGFNGKKTYVEVAANKEFSQPTSGKGLTVEVWMCPDVLEFKGETSDPYVFWMGKGTPGHMEWAFRFYSKKSTRPNRISAYIFNKEGKKGAGAYFQDAVKPKEWIHVVATYDPGDKTHPKAGVSIYKDGVFRGGPSNQKGSLYSAYDIVPEVGSAPLRFATRDFTSFFDGGLDEVAIYPRVLSAAEILEHYKLGTKK
jgi:hypothetical protein